MGIERRIEFAAPPVLDWPRLVEQLMARGRVPAVKMIDDLPAFPGEVPPADWRELRLGFAAGMVTVRRSGPDLVCLVWGTADGELTATQAALAEALTEQAGGRFPDRAG